MRAHRRDELLPRDHVPSTEPTALESPFIRSVDVPDPPCVMPHTVELPNHSATVDTSQTGHTGLLSTVPRRFPPGGGNRAEAMFSTTAALATLCFTVKRPQGAQGAVATLTVKQRGATPPLTHPAKRSEAKRSEGMRAACGGTSKAFDSPVMSVGREANSSNPPDSPSHF